MANVEFCGPRLHILLKSVLWWIGRRWNGHLRVGLGGRGPAHRHCRTLCHLREESILNFRRLFSIFKGGLPQIVLDVETETDARQIFCRISMCLIIGIGQVPMELCLRIEDHGVLIEPKFEISIKRKSFLAAHLFKFLFNLFGIPSEGHKLSYIFLHVLCYQIFLACLFILIDHSPFLPCFIEVSFAAVVAQPRRERRVRQLFLRCRHILKLVEFF